MSDVNRPTAVGDPGSVRRLAEIRRMAFRSVMSACEELDASIGTWPAMDIESAVMSSAKYKNDVSFLKVTDYVVDVHRVIRKTLNDGELKILQNNFEGRGSERGDRFTDQDKDIQERLGVAFITFDLHPVSKYFKGAEIAKYQGQVIYDTALLSRNFIDKGRG